MDIKNHPDWSSISSYKKPAHLLRFFLARKIAAFYPRSMFVGITGSVGKTTTKELCLAVLSQKYKTIASSENINPVFNIPATLLRIRPDVKKVVLEMGIEYPGEMDFYLSLVHPAVGIITRIFYAHSQYLGDIERIAEEKSLLIKQLPKDGLAILNWDDVYSRRMAKETAGQVIFYGLNPENCHVWASNIRLEDGQTCFELNFGVERVDVALNLLGRHFIYDALAAAAVGISNNMTLATIKRGLSKVNAPPHRLRLLEGDGWYVLDDTYNSSPAALEEAFNVVNELPAHRRILVLGEMRELGIYSEKFHRLAAQQIYKDKFDLVLLGGGETKFIADELVKLGFSPERLDVNLSHSQLVTNILRVVKKGDLVLVKGSRAVRLEEVVKRITKQ